jgi:hypothetical protein
VNEQPHPHTPVNVNLIRAIETQTGNFSQRLAVRVTTIVGTMACAYIFVLLAILGFPGLHATLPQYVQWFSGTFLQLVMLPVLAVGTAQLGRHQELQADEQFRLTQKICADNETMIKQNTMLLDQFQQRTQQLPVVSYDKEINQSRPGD